MDFSGFAYQPGEEEEWREVNSEQKPHLRRTGAPRSLECRGTQSCSEQEYTFAHVGPPPVIGLSYLPVTCLKNPGTFAFPGLWPLCA
jgi:hypothetical protein